MANGKIGDNILGYFTEKNYGNDFEFKDVDCQWLKDQGCTHEIAVGGAPHHYHYRGAKLLKTVVYVLVDENENGAVWEKWNIKNRVNFDSITTHKKEISNFYN